ncbi:MAG: ABC transporter substrate-binding protein [Burkholderiaceae bacterium]
MAADRSLWYTRCPLPTASGIALDAGILQDRMAAAGLSVASIESAGDPSARASHFTHATPKLFRQGGNIPPIWARSNGAETALVGIAWTREYQTILARPEASIRSAEELRGKRLALPVRTSGEIDFWQAMCLRGYDSALRTAGLTLDDVELVRLPVVERYIEQPARGEQQAWMWAGAARTRRQQAETFAFIRGEVDALYASGALGAQLEALLQAQVVVDLGFHPDRRVQINNQVPNILTADAALARERPDVVARYLRALNEAADWAAGHADDARRTCAREVGAPEEWIDISYRRDHVERLTVSLGDELIGAVAEQKRFLLQHGFITRDFDIEDWVSRQAYELSIREDFA